MIKKERRRRKKNGFIKIDDQIMFSHIYPFDRCRKLPKGLKEWQAFLDLKKKIDDFNETCPLLELMANKAMKMRHWDRITNVTGHTFDIESDTFLLRNIMEAPLLEHKEDIEVIMQRKVISDSPYTILETIIYILSLLCISTLFTTTFVAMSLFSSIQHILKRVIFVLQ